MKARIKGSHKFGAKWVTLCDPDGRAVKFPSRMEAAHIVSLWEKLATGEIRGLVLQPRYAIHVAGPKGPVHVFDYIADAAYTDVATDVHHVDDVKGMDTEVSKLKRLCVEAEHDIIINVIRLKKSIVDQRIAWWTARARRIA